MIVFPNAKVNIGLDIISRRADGYHEIATAMVPVAWRDILEIVPSKSGATTLTVSGRGVACELEKNLVMKAYRALERRMPMPAVDIYLHKIIPDGAGLGGGSSDAAFTLKALNDMFALSLPDDDLAEIAAELGADCPFFIYNRPMLAQGIGTDLSPLDLNLEGLTTAIVKPPFSISTAEAYGGVVPSGMPTKLHLLGATPREEWQQLATNDFQPALQKKYPQISEAISTLTAEGALYASLSGSGSAVFGLFTEADNLSERLKERLPEFDIFVG